MREIILLWFVGDLCPSWDSPELFIPILQRGVEMKAEPVGAAGGVGMKGSVLRSVLGEQGLTPDQKPSRGINNKTEAAAAEATMKNNI